MQETQEMKVWTLDWEDTLEEEMATHYSILAWRILWTEEPGGLQSMGSQSVRHDWAHTHTHTHTHTSIWAAITNMIEWVAYKQHKFISNSSRVWAVQHQYTSVHVMSISWFTDNCLIPVSSHGEWEREGRSALISWPNNHLKPLLPNTAIRLGVRI